MLILNQKIKYCTRKTFRNLGLALVGAGIIFTVVLVKYKPAYKVTSAGELLGYVRSKNVIETEFNEYMTSKENNIAYRENDMVPEYSFELVERSEELSDDKVLTTLESNTVTTYKYYAITSDDGVQRALATSQEEAQSYIDEVKAGVDEKVGLNYGIAEVFQQTPDNTTKEEAINALNEVKGAKIAVYEQGVAAEKKKQQEAAAAKARALAVASTSSSSGPAGAINGMSLIRPVGGMISSRFGGRGRGVHTGLDIATSMGTGVAAASGGTVVFAAYSGGYGNIVKIDHGNGVQTWYAHLSAIYVSPGQAVGQGSIIGAVGSTGNSTGPHLHLEIRINGEPVNPQNYLY